MSGPFDPIYQGDPRLDILNLNEACCKPIDIFTSRACEGLDNPLPEGVDYMSAADRALLVHAQITADEALLEVRAEVTRATGAEAALGALIANLTPGSGGGGGSGDGVASLTAQVINLKAQLDGNTASITTIAHAQVTDEYAIASLTTSLNAKFDAASASIVSESIVRASADSATASQITTLTAQLNSATASITEETTARVTTTSAMATQITTLTAQYSSAIASITNESTVRSDALSAVATQISTLNAQYASATASISSEATARANADSATASQITTLTAQYGSVAASITTNATAIATANSQLASLQTSVTTQGASIQTNATAITTANSNIASLTTALNALGSSGTSDSAAIVSEALARTNADSALASQITTLTASYNTLSASITNESSVRASADSATATQITTINSQIAGVTASISSEATTRANANSAIASQISVINAQVGSAVGSISTEAVARANADSALSSQISTLTAQYNSAAASIATEASTRASADSATASTVSTLSARLATNANLIKNPTGTNGTDNWLPGYGNFGSYLGTYGEGYYFSTSDLNFYRYQDIAYQGAGSTMSFQALVFAGGLAKVSGTYALARVYGQFLDGVGNPLGYGFILQVNAGAYWTPLKAENFPVPTGTFKLRLYIDIVTDGVITNTNVAWRQMKLEYGPNCTLYSDDTTPGVTYANLVNESTVRASADSAMASQISTLVAQYNAATASITSESSTRASADTSLSNQITTLNATYGSLSASVATNSTAIASANSQIASLNSTVATQGSSITSNATAISNANSNIASLTSSLSAQAGINSSVSSQIASESATRASADSSLSSQITALNSTYGSLSSSLSTESTTRANADSTLTSQVTTLTAFAKPRPNLVRNPTGSMGRTYWTPYQGVIGAGVGSYGEGTVFYADATSTSNANRPLMFQDIPFLAVGSPVSFQCDIYTGGLVKTSGTYVYARLYIEYINSSGGHIDYSDVISVPGQSAGVYTNFQIQGQTVPAGTVTLRVTMDIIGDGTWFQNGTNWRNIKVESGATCTAYTDDMTSPSLFSSISTNAVAIATANSQIATLQSTVATQGASVTTNATAISTTNANLAALGSTVSSQGSTLSLNTAAISSEASTRASADASLSSQITTLNSNYGLLSSSISSEATTRASADTALSSRTTTLEVVSGSDASSLNNNPTFKVWSNPTIPPDSWSWWDASAGITRAAGVNGRPYGLQFSPAANVNSGIVQVLTASFGAYVIEVSGRATDWQGAGVFIQFLNAARNTELDNTFLNCATDPDTSGYASADGGSGAYTRTWSKFYKTAIAGNIQALNIYAMANWSGFGARNAKTVTFDRVSIRPATAAEIAAQTVIDANIIARVTTNESVIATANSQIASLNSTVATHGSSITSNAYAITNANANIAAINSTLSAQSSTNASLTARLTTNEGAISAANNKLTAYWQTTAVAGNGRAQLTIHADSNGGGGVDIIGDVSISGDLLVGGSVSTPKIQNGAFSSFVTASVSNVSWTDAFNAGASNHPIASATYTPVSTFSTVIVTVSLSGYGFIRDNSNSRQPDYLLVNESVSGRQFYLVSPSMAQQNTLTFQLLFNGLTGPTTFAITAMEPNGGTAYEEGHGFVGLCTISVLELKK